MKSFLKNILTLSVVVAAASMAQAQTRGGSRGGNAYTGSPSYGSSVSFTHQNEIITNFTEGSFFSGKQTKDGPSYTIINVGAKYLRTMNANVQAGGLVNLNSISGGGGKTYLTAVAVGVYNFDVDFKNALFAEGGIGIYPVANNTGDVESKLGFYVGGGKRFPIWERVSFIPTLALVKKGDVDLAFDVQFLNFSIMF